MKVRVSSVSAAFLLAFASSGGLPAAAAAPSAFQFATFGTPAAPTPFNSPDWDVQVHSRGFTPSVHPMDAQHGPGCQGYPATHPVSTPEDSVFVCNNHLMTSINDPGYGEIVLTPDQLADFSSGTATVDFDVSTFSTSLRDWIDLWISPFSENLALPYYGNQPDLQGPPRHAVNVRLESGGLNNPKTYFSASVYNDFAKTAVPGRSGYIEDLLTPSEITRTHLQLQISRTHIKFGMPDYNNGAGYWWVDGAVPDLGWSQGVVQFVHHSYNPMKPGLCLTYTDTVNNLPCTPDTWHWANFTISPSVPFTMIKANEPVATATSQRVTFPKPAPANAFLRFAGAGNASGIQVSYDGGSTWQAAQHPNQAYFDANGATSSYWMPIPKGQSSVLFRETSNYEGYSFYVRDIAIWVNAPNAAGGPVSNPPATPLGTGSGGSGGAKPPTPVAGEGASSAGGTASGEQHARGTSSGLSVHPELASSVMRPLLIAGPVALLLVLLAVGIGWVRSRRRSMATRRQR